MENLKIVRKTRAVELQKQYDLTAQECADFTRFTKHSWKKWLYERHPYHFPSTEAIEDLEAAIPLILKHREENNLS